MASYPADLAVEPAAADFRETFDRTVLVHRHERLANLGDLAGVENLADDKEAVAVEPGKPLIGQT